MAHGFRGISAHHSRKSMVEFILAKTHVRDTADHDRQTGKLDILM